MLLGLRQGGCQSCAYTSLPSPAQLANDAAGSATGIVVRRATDDYVLPEISRCEGSVLRVSLSDGMEPHLLRAALARQAPAPQPSRRHSPAPTILTEMSPPQAAVPSGRAVRRAARGVRPQSSGHSAAAHVFEHRWEETRAAYHSPAICRFPGTSCPRGKAATRRGRGALRVRPRCVRPPRSPGEGVSVPSAGAPPAGAPPQGWLPSSQQTVSLRTHGACAPVAGQMMPVHLQGISGRDGGTATMPVFAKCHR
jgi:hypothetical protein